MKKIIALLLTLIMALSLAACGEKTPVDNGSEAEVKWPQSNVQLVLPYGAGGGTDLTARTLADSLGDYGNFGVVNNTDGGGVVGWEQVRTSNPEICDQLIFALNSMFVTYLSGVSEINPMTDIEPVFAIDSNIAYFVVVNKDAPYNTLEELIKYSKANPGTVTLGAGAPGSSMTIMTSQFIDSTGIDCKLVATSGSDADAVAMVMGGNMDIYLTNQTTTQNYLEAGEVKVLASIHPISDASSELIKSIPTLEDLGYKNVTMGTQFIVWAPIGADPAVYEKINELFNAAFEDPDTQAAFKERGNDYVSFGGYEETKTKLEANYADCQSAWNSYQASQS